MQKLIDSLTLYEKARLLSGVGFRTYEIKEKNIPSLIMADGPHGLRYVKSDNMLDFGLSEIATAFPCEVNIASSFNPENAYKMGVAIAREARRQGVKLILGPGLNIKRNPLGGRSFEYYSEDPYLSGVMGTEFINGAHEGGIGVSAKHFALNNQENFRMSGDSIADERTIRDIYLKPFEMVVKGANPDTIMCAYNKVNGVYASENKRLLTEILRDEWDFSGLVMSDWGATHDRVKGIIAGLDLEMPGGADASVEAIIDAVKSGELDTKALDLAVLRVLTLINKLSPSTSVDVSFDEHHTLAKRICIDSAVLLKNESVLPLNCKEEFTVLGDFFENARFQGAGSSLINATRVPTLKEIFDAEGISYTESLTEGEKTALLFLGLSDTDECECRDRATMSLDARQLELIKETKAKGKRVCVILFGGGAMELPFADEVDAILYMGLGGEAVSEATYDILFGRASPSGRLSESWPLSYDDVPSAGSFSKSEYELYCEGIYVGYRYYQTADVPVRYPFGYGLSYTSFEYSNFSIKETDEGALATVTVKNVGRVRGGEVIMLFVSQPDEYAHKPRRELCAFDKVYLEGGEERVVTLRVNKRELSYFNTTLNTRVMDKGEYTFAIAKDVNTPILEAVLTLGDNTVSEELPPDLSTAYRNADIKAITDKVLCAYLGVEAPQPKRDRKITLDSRFMELKRTFFGKILYHFITKIPKSRQRKARKLKDRHARVNAIKSSDFLRTSFDYNTINAMSYASGGMMSLNLARGLVEIANGRLIRGIRLCLKKYKIDKE